LDRCASGSISVKQIRGIVGKTEAVKFNIPEAETVAAEGFDPRAL